MNTREKVLRWRARGWTYREISERLGVCLATVRNHLKAAGLTRPRCSPPPCACE